MTRMLLIADDAFDDERALPSCLDALDGVDEVDVVAPLIASRIEVLTDDEEAYREASERAERVADELADRGITASGERSVEDPFDTALTRLDTGEYDGVVLAVTGEGHWREEGLLERLRDRTDVPITEVVID